MLGKYIEALASAHRRVAEAKGRVARHEDLRLFLLKIREVEAAEVLASRIGELVVDLDYLETGMSAAAARVFHAFNTVAGDN